MIFHENRLPADEPHVISAANYRWRFMGKPSWDTEFDLVPIVYPFFNSLPPGKFIMFCRLLIFFQNQLFRKILSGIPPECKPV